MTGAFPHASVRTVVRSSGVSLEVHVVVVVTSPSVSVRVAPIVLVKPDIRLTWRPDSLR